MSAKIRTRLNPIEPVFAKLKHLLRSALPLARQKNARTVSKLKLSKPLPSASVSLLREAIVINHSGHAIDERLTLSVGLESALELPE
ncbi:hypothetical protein [Bradyrhizobium sp. BWC-3-1]|uniref:hypothetical protein n=1 Tax=Bradyrhizobium sp. BWC-3-1 TaxID=3080012 RepID=UPI00293EFB50|nr:hypothetical protein [Bradyrhizobium sp. BWC-3-1]WOH61271.1 hypothetical protein RX329_14705 [Bradyrhizobium sp. BWC-3-1]